MSISSSHSGRFFIFARGLLITQDDITFKYYGGGAGFILIKGGKIQMKGSKDIIIKGKKIAQN